MPENNLDSIKGKDFLAFIQDDLVPKLCPDHRMIMDCLNCHKVEGIVEAIREGAKILCLPTCAPDFNLIEMLWSVLEHHIRLLRPQPKKLLLHLIDFFLCLSEKDSFGNWLSEYCCCAT
ncbi:MAG: hypothetical protein HC919_08400 [Oscillatoriales cyanobacterium SM2_2_1]|nr:hypothetical protein [Oscillatoriales cyanobacterium SM2_2_1]